MMRKIELSLCFLTVVLACRVSYAQSDPETLRIATEDPVYPLMSVPISNETLFGGGIYNRNGNILSLNPTVPFNQDGVNILLRAKIPIITKPGFESREATHGGLGDTTLTTYFSPTARRRAYNWGLGFMFGFPTATRKDLGAGKWTAGPAAAISIVKKNIVTCMTVSALFSYAGRNDRPNVKKFYMEPYVYYNMKNGWYMLSRSRVEGDWKIKTTDRWLVPLGGGAGKVFYISKQAVNASAEAFYYVAKPDLKPHPNWGLRFTFSLLFPKDD